MHTDRFVQSELFLWKIRDFERTPAGMFVRTLHFAITLHLHRFIPLSPHVCENLQIYCTWLHGNNKFENLDKAPKFSYCFF